MTQTVENVEPPLARPSVQITLGLVAALALVGALRSVPDRSSGRHNGVAARHPDNSIEIDLNAADARELSLLPGVGPVLASRIMENRDRLGPFDSLADVGRVHGVGPKTLVEIQIYCVVAPHERDDRLVSSRDVER